MPNQITLPLDIPDVEVLGVKTSAQGAYIIKIRSTVEGAHCRRCGRFIDEFHGYASPIELRHLPILGHIVYLRLRAKRYRCPYCDNHPTSTQKLVWYSAKSRCTHAYEEHILLQLVNSTVQDVSRKEQLGYEHVEGILRRRVQTQVNWERFTELGVLGIDEIARRKGHRDYLALVTARLADGQVVLLAVLPDRLKVTVKAFLDQIPQYLRRTVHTFCTDLWRGYINAAHESFDPDPECAVQIVADRFHVAKGYRAGPDKLRKQELRRLKRELSEDAYRQLKHTMWPFRKAPQNLTTEEKQRLDHFFTYSPQLKLAYELQQQLTAIFDALISPEQALELLTEWRISVMDSKLTCFDAFLTTLANWFDEILNYFHHRYSSGFVEGFNNKVKVLKRRCYGLLNVGHIFQRLFLDLEGFRLFGPATH